MPRDLDVRAGRPARRRAPLALVAALALITAGLTPPEARAEAPAPAPAPSPAPSPAGDAWPAPATAGGPITAAPPQQPAPPPAPPPAPAEDDDDDDDPPSPPGRAARAMGVAGLASGISVLGLTYLITGLTGVIMHDVGVRRSRDPATEERGRQLKAIGGRLLIPVAGPFVALPHMSEEDGKVLGAVSGGFQVIGLGLTIFGAVQLARSKSLRREAEGAQAWARRRLFVSGVATPRYSGASVLVRF